MKFLKLIIIIIFSICTLIKSNEIITKCSNESIYPNDLPIMLFILSNIKETRSSYLSVSIKGRACFEQGIHNNPIFELSNGTIIDIPSQLINKEFDAKFININFRGEILSFDNLLILINLNNQTNLYKITTKFKYDTNK